MVEYRHSAKDVKRKEASSTTRSILKGKLCKNMVWSGLVAFDLEAGGEVGIVPLVL